MNLHLAEISSMVTPGKHAVLLLDQAGWHLSGDVVVPDNITLLPLPPKCPELNVMENVWQFMRDNWLSNRIFRDHDDIVDHGCRHWNRLTEQPWRIMSVSVRFRLRPWRLDAAQVASGRRFHGASSPMRLIGWSAMRSRSTRR